MPVMNRALSRDTALCLLYARELGGENDYYVITDMLERDPDKLEMDYISEVLAGVTEHKAELDELIAANLRGWTIERLARVDLTIMRIALFEMLHIDSISAPVSINEAVELSKVYSTEKAGPLINGVLGTISRSLKSEPNG